MATQQTNHVRGTRADLNAVIARIPSMLEDGDHNAHDALERAGLTLLGRIREAFVVKSRGGTDEAGDRWAPLLPKTVEAKRRRRKQQRGGQHDSPAMRRLRSVLQGKRGRATYLFDKYARSRPEDILVGSGALLDSLTPGSDSAYAVFDIGERGDVRFGTTRPGAAAHHSGVPGKLPQRRLWPEPARWPPHWWDDILGPVVDAVVDLVGSEVRSL